MKHACIILPDGNSIVVDASGSRLGARDAATRVLHVLPQLYVPGPVAAWLDSSYVELDVVSEFPIVPPDGIVVRQPMPNKRYFIGGSSETRYGWFVPLPDDASTLQVEFRWLLHQACDSRLVETENYEVRHKIGLRLIEGGSGNTYTMDSVCWSSEDRPQGFHRLNAWMAVPDDDAPPDAIKHRRLSTASYRRDDDGMKLDGHLIEEEVSIPSIELDQLWTVQEFEHEQIHELQHQRSFTRCKELHEGNATCSLPPDVFIQAVQLARTVDFGRDSEFFDNCEEHPANRLLADWWQKNNSDQVKFPVGFAMPWVRVEDDDRYWCGYHESPDEPMKLFAKSRSAQARVGDFVLLMFYARKDHYIPAPGGLTLVLANGQKDSEIGGVEIEEHDEAWYALVALQDFPSRFPDAWKEILRQDHARTP